MVKLQWTGSEKDTWIEVSLKTAHQSKKIKNMIEGLGAGAPDDAIQLPTISKETLEKVVACMKIIENGDTNGDQLDAEVKDLKDEAKINLLKAANYLDIKPLQNACIRSFL